MMALVAYLGRKRLTFRGSWEGSRCQSPDFLAPWLLRLDCSAALRQRHDGKPESLVMALVLLCSSWVIMLKNSGD